MASSKCVVPSSHLECSLCRNRFTDPRILPCGHTFCLECIRKQIKSNEQNACAKCRQQWNLTPKSVSNLPKNFGLAAIILAANNENDICMRRNSPKEEQSVCNEHVNVRYFIFCSDCKIPACAYCGLHSGHKFIEYKLGAAEFRSLMDEKLKELEKKLATCKKELNVFEEKVHQKRTEQKAIEKEIEACNDSVKGVGFFDDDY